MSYDHKSIEKKWQDKWDKEELYKTDDLSKKPKYYCLDMFPYPSGAGLHVGHPEGYTATDIVSRYKRMNGFEVLHPMGWDAFGLPAENYAIKTGVPPEKSTRDNIKTFKRQIKSLGLSYDWSREFATCDLDYYKWTQWFFLLFYKKGLAYRKEAKVNWCESCKTVLANEQVIDDHCERCNNQVVQKNLKQWFFKTTAYADRLVDDLEKIDFPEKLKLMQKNWIGRKEWIDITYPLKDLDREIVVSTTRPDTNFGATFVVIAPENELLNAQDDFVPKEQREEVDAYINEALKKTELERVSEGRKKSGVFTGRYAVNKLNNTKLPIYVADFVLNTVGTGMVVGVPGHDMRDFEFAKACDLPIKRVVVGPDGDTTDITDAHQVQEDAGTMINSDFLDGLEISVAISKMMDYLEEKGWGKRTIRYHLRDWLISRQRYWGTPIPIVYCDECGELPLSTDELPVVLPTDVDFKPTGESPLKGSKTFHEVTCPKCGKSGEGVKRESDTLDTFVCSSWYFFRYLDSKNEQEFCSKEKIQKWMPVDLYVGGAEHAVGHLIYSRFFTKVLYDEGLCGVDEPFKRLINQGLIMAEDGRKMSKSLGNVINPDEVVYEYGADTMRMYEMFMGPLEDSKPWDTKGIMGIKRFLDKVWGIAEKKDLEDNESEKSLEKVLIKTIKKVTEDIESLSLNTAISAMMIFLNAFQKSEAADKKSFETFLLILSPFAPHLTEEIWEKLGHKNSIFKESWPQYNEALLVEDQMEIPIQINGKVRGTIMVASDSTEEDIIALAKEVKNVQKFIEGKEIKKTIYVEGRLLNFVVI
ncbi:leucine--tRNA ligase [Patescibacteria group bacterium]|nr:leucine--tRNA ligase [Patescibacteria group bacterium]